MVLKRTVRVKLSIPDERRDDLKRTMLTFREAAQMFANRGWERDADGYVITSRTVYKRVRKETELHADLCIGAVNLAADSLRSAVERMKAGKRAGKPTFSAPTTVYNTNAVSYFDGYCTLAAFGGRVRAEYVYPDDENCPQTRYLSGEWDRKGATLHYDRDGGDYYLHITVEKDDEKLGETENGTVLGVDLGVENVAVTSTGAFWGGGYLNHRRDEYERTRGKLQQTGTESAYRTIKQMGTRESRWANDYLHRVSKALVHEAITHTCSPIAFEDLTDIRERMPGVKKFHVWAFKQLCEYVEYKAAEFGIRTVQVDPAYTSQRCSCCGTTLREHRPSQAEFLCRKCGYEVHADYNAAKNSATKYVRAGQKRPSGRVNRQLALKSGTLNGNGGVFPCQRRRVGQTGSSPTSPGVYAGVVDPRSERDAGRRRRPPPRCRYERGAPESPTFSNPKNNVHTGASHRPDTRRFSDANGIAVPRNAEAVSAASNAVELDAPAFDGSLEPRRLKSAHVRAALVRLDGDRRRARPVRSLRGFRPGWTRRGTSSPLKRTRQRWPLRRREPDGVDLAFSTRHSPVSVIARLGTAIEARR
ncbi:RNA-guided endonuclease InsQ/TnpB family protein [Halegenticoccus soli]|uniref:RNA-guided endonuclease InsQ/TnpB family protein n=1 Tax=Halegenticoccus soli TaxID=1985678 RepID=UPI001E3E2D96|nr:transposase [Halegenticoccus soli]